MNSTAVTQPLDQGIIRAVKALFNGKKFRDILEKIEQGQDTFEAYKNFTTKDAIIMLILVWDEIKKIQLSVALNTLSRLTIVI